MGMEKRLIKFIGISNWVIFSIASGAGLLFAQPPFVRGIIFGGLIVTINFYLLERTLKNAFTPPRISSVGLILGKYYFRFTISGFIIFALIVWKVVQPIGLLVGLSVVVASITLATMRELKTLIFKEAI